MTGLARMAWPLLAISLVACGPGADESSVDPDRELNAQPNSAGGDVPAPGADALAPADPAAAGEAGPADGAIDGESAGETAGEANGGTNGASSGETAGDLTESAVQYQARQGESPSLAVATDAMREVVACVQCHGSNGAGKLALHTPKIGGLEAWYLARQLKLFKAGLRGGTDEDLYGSYMRSIVLVLDEAELEALAAHFAALEPEPVPSAVEGDANRGQELYTVCSACHGPTAEGSVELNTPTLVGQSGPYMVRQLEYFRTGLRGADPMDLFGQQMVPIVQTNLMSRQDSLDVVAYIQMLSDNAADGADAGEASAQAGQ